MEIKLQNNSAPTRFRFLAKVIVITLTILISAKFLPGISVDNPFTAVVAALVIALLNMFLRPILVVLTLPLTIVTLGLSLLLVNAFIIYLAGKIVPGLYVENLWWAFCLSILITVLGYLIELPGKWMNKRKRQQQDPYSDYPNDDNEGFTDYEDVTNEEDETNDTPKLK